MDIFSQNKLFIRLIILLVILNLISIGILLFNPNFFSGKNEHSNLALILKKKLALSEQQCNQIKQLRADFFEKERKLESIIRDEKDSMNIAMFNSNTDEELVKQLAKKIADHEFEMEMLRFEQAKKLKKICSREQLLKFEALVLEIRDYFKPDNQSHKK